MVRVLSRKVREPAPGRRGTAHPTATSRSGGSEGSGERRKGCGRPGGAGRPRPDALGIGEIPTVAPLRFKSGVAA